MHALASHIIMFSILYDSDSDVGRKKRKVKVVGCFQPWNSYVNIPCHFESIPQNT